jgi:ribosomal protein S9
MPSSPEARLNMNVSSNKISHEINTMDDCITISLQPYELAALDLWIAMNPGNKMSRSDAIRTIITRTIIKQK